MKSNTFRSFHKNYLIIKPLLQFIDAECKFSTIDEQSCITLSGVYEPISGTSF